jgi:cell division protein ZapA
MAYVEVMINGRGYAVACDDGQEAHVAQLSRYVEDKVKALLPSVGQVGDARLLLLAGLMIADELAESERALKHAQRDAPQPMAPLADDDAGLARRLDELTDRIEAIADGLERD